MTEPRSPRPITVTQVVSVLAAVLIILFIAAFADRAVESYRLGVWLAEMDYEIAALERTREALELERERRMSDAWIDQALREAGRFPPDVLVVRVVTPALAAPALHTPTPPAPEAVTEFTPLQPQGQATGPLFGNPNWEAWMELLFGRP